MTYALTGSMEETFFPLVGPLGKLERIGRKVWESRLNNLPITGSYRKLGWIWKEILGIPPQNPARINAYIPYSYRFPAEDTLSIAGSFEKVGKIGRNVWKLCPEILPIAGSFGKVGQNLKEILGMLP